MTTPVIREIAGYEEARRCVAFQAAIWGRDFGEIVPAAILWVVARNGGVVAGAFHRDELVGFLFGLTGVRDGEVVHWSDMLAVHPEHRGRGIGRTLKRYQRQRLLEAGISRCNWTYDPLEAGNAHLNFTRLGVTASEYVRDCYGVSQSPLHRGLATDRLVVEWRVASDRVRERMEGEPSGSQPSPGARASARAAVVINPGGSEPRLDLEEPVLHLLIPANTRELVERDIDRAVLWRQHTRAAFERYFGKGYTAVEAVAAGADMYAYVLARG